MRKLLQEFLIISGGNFEVISREEIRKFQTQSLEEYIEDLHRRAPSGNISGLIPGRIHVKTLAAIPTEILEANLRGVHENKTEAFSYKYSDDIRE